MSNSFKGKVKKIVTELRLIYECMINSHRQTIQFKTPGKRTRNFEMVEMNDKLNAFYLINKLVVSI